MFAHYISIDEDTATVSCWASGLPDLSYSYFFDEDQLDALQCAHEYRAKCLRAANKAAALAPVSPKKQRPTIKPWMARRLMPCNLFR